MAVTVGIIIPTHNRARFIESSVSSALEQTHQEVEVVVVDDASDDETPRLLSALARSNPRLRVVRNNAPRGAAAARNLGVTRTRTPIIAFLDDDCVWAPDKLERQIALLTPARGVVYCRQAIRGVTGAWIVEGGAAAEDAPLDGLLESVNIGAPSLLLRREHFEAIGGFDEALPRLQDWDLVLRLAHQTGFAFDPAVLVQGVQVDTGISSHPERLEAAADRIIERHAPHLTRDQFARLHYRLGKFLLAEGLTFRAQKLMLRSVRLAPMSLFGWAGTAAALLGPRPARWIRSMRRRQAAKAAFASWIPGQQGPALEGPSSEVPDIHTEVQR